MATEGPSAFFAARGENDMDLPEVRLLLLLLERAAEGLAAAAPEEERGAESIFCRSKKTEKTVQRAEFDNARPLLEERDEGSREGCSRRDEESWRSPFEEREKETGKKVKRK